MERVYATPAYLYYLIIYFTNLPDLELCWLYLLWYRALRATRLLSYLC